MNSDNIRERRKSLLSTKRRKPVTTSLDWDNVIRFAQRRTTVDKETLEKEEPRPEVNFCTGSSYTGTWNCLNMSGYGTYVLPYGVKYEGEMFDGMFHGEGTLTYPLHGQKVKGFWDKGRLITFQFEFADGLVYNEPWDYCEFPDRRFFPIEYENELQPAGRENLTKEQPTRTIRDECYDVGDGFYHPKHRLVTLPMDEHHVIRLDGQEDDAVLTQYVKEIGSDVRFIFNRTSTKPEHQWIVSHCRKAWDESTGLRPDLYEMWFTGRKEDFVIFDRNSEDSEFSDCKSWDESASVCHRPDLCEMWAASRKEELDIFENVKECIRLPRGKEHEKFDNCDSGTVVNSM